MNYDFVSQITEKYNTELFFDKSLAPYTSFKIGGECDVLVKANCAEVIGDIISECKSRNVPYRILGRGSNLLVSDKGVRGVVIHIANDFANICMGEDDEEMIVCDAGASLGSVCTFAREKSLSGLEFAYGIPGSAGGALFMNAGAYGGEISDVIHSCKYLENGVIKEVFAADMDLSYRHSMFMESDRVILQLCFKLKHADEYKITSRMNELMQKRKDKQPLEYPSAGSTFKRPEGDFASRLVDVCGLKGLSVGGAQVSEKHSGFLINRGGATFEDMMKLIEIVKAEVYSKEHIMLECEVEIWN